MLRPLIFTAAVTAGLVLAAGAYTYRVVQYDCGADSDRESRRPLWR
jgi:hypothetical protein